MNRILYKACLISAGMLVLLSMVPFIAMADGGEDELAQTVNGYRVALVFEKPIISGENQIHLQVSNAQGQPVSNADVEVRVVEAEAGHTEAELTEAEHTEAELTEAELTEAEHTEAELTESEQTEAEASASHGNQHDMEDMGASPSSSNEHDDMGLKPFAAGAEEGEYAGEIIVADSGEWIIQVHLTVGELMVEFDFPLHVASSRIGKNILLGFFAINAVIIGTAATVKFKPAAVQHFRDLSND